MSSAVSPLAPANVPDLPAIDGVRLATAQAGIRYKNRTDVLLAAFDKGTTVAGVLTRSKCPSAPVEWCRARLKGGKARALVVNSGNANAFTGKSGRAATALTAKIAAQALGCSVNDIFLASTGVIGEPLDATKFDGVLQTLADAAAPGQYSRRRQGDHDHRYVSESRNRASEARQGHGHDQRHRQGRRHDRARHGDDAFLRVHRRADRGRRASETSVRRRRRYLQRRHYRRRHLDLRHPARFRDRNCCRARRAKDRARHRSAPERISESSANTC